MPTLLHIEASPLKPRSHTIETARAFLSAYAESHLDDTIETVDLWTETLPPFDGTTIDAKFAVLRRNEFTPPQAARWRAVREVSRRFNTADKYVFSVPMWNFGIPYPLKHYIDVVTLAGENWTWTRKGGYKSLLTGKKALLIYSSAGAYPLALPPDPADFQKPYLRHWLSFIGISDVEEINVAPTLADPEVVSRVRSDARARGIALAHSF